jgi:hypothetical protein
MKERFNIKRDILKVNSFINSFLGLGEFDQIQASLEANCLSKIIQRLCLRYLQCAQGLILKEEIIGAQMQFYQTQIGSEVIPRVEAVLSLS